MSPIWIKAADGSLANVGAANVIEIVSQNYVARRANPGATKTPDGYAVVAHFNGPFSVLSYHAERAGAEASLAELLGLLREEGVAL